MVLFLSLLLILPLAGFVATLAAGATLRRARTIALAFSFADTVVAGALLVAFLGTWLDPLRGPRAPYGTPAGTFPVYFVERYAWVPPLGMNVILGVDGLSVPLIFLTPLLTTLAIVFSFKKEERPRQFFALLLLLEFSISGVFLSLDCFLGAEPGRVRPPGPHVRHDRLPDRGGAARVPRDPAPRDPDPDLLRVLLRVRREAADGPVPYVAARRARGGADRGLRDPGGPAPEDGRVRRVPNRPGDAARRGEGPVVAPRGLRRGLDGVRQLRLPGPDGPEAARRVLERGAHGLRPPRGLEPRPAWHRGRDLPAVRARPHHRGPVHARGDDQARRGHAGDPRPDRAGEGDAPVLVRPNRRVPRLPRVAGPRVVLGGVLGVHGLLRRARGGPVAGPRRDPHAVDRGDRRVLHLDPAQGRDGGPEPRPEGAPRPERPGAALLLGPARPHRLRRPVPAADPRDDVRVRDPPRFDPRRDLSGPRLPDPLRPAPHARPRRGRRVPHGAGPRERPHRRPHDLRRPARPLPDCAARLPEPGPRGPPAVHRARRDVHVPRVRVRVLAPAGERRVHRGRRRAVRAPRVPHRPPHGPGADDQLGGAPPGAGVLRDVPPPRDDDPRGLRVPGLLPVLPVLGGGARPDVLHHRSVGRPAEALRGAEVLPVHVRRVHSRADRDLRVLLLRAHVQHGHAHRGGPQRDPDPRGRNPKPPVHRPPGGIRHEAPDMAPPHVAPGRARRSPHGRVRDPGGRPPEARRVRDHPRERPNAPAGVPRDVLDRRDPRDREHPVRRVRVPRAGRPEADGRVLEREPHGLRDPRGRGGNRGLAVAGDRRGRAPGLRRRRVPDVRARPRVRGPVHGRGLDRTQDGDPEHLRARGDRLRHAEALHVHDGLLPRVPRAPRARGVRGGAGRVPRGVRRLRVPRPHPAHHGRHHHRVLHLGDAARNLRPAEPAVEGPARRPPARIDPDGRPHRPVRALRNPAGAPPEHDDPVGGPCPGGGVRWRRRSCSSPRSS